MLEQAARECDAEARAMVTAAREAHKVADEATARANDATRRALQASAALAAYLQDPANNVRSAPRESDDGMLFAIDDLGGQGGRP
jgi:hypothetical protein